MTIENTQTNLDFLCMKAAQEMVTCEGDADKKENAATKALGVLLENGPYGLMLYLETYRDKEIAKHYRCKLLSLCAEKRIAAYINNGVEVPTNGDFILVTDWLRSIAQALDRYLFVKQLWQQSLTYARYHAKAPESQSDAPSTNA